MPDPLIQRLRSMDWPTPTVDRPTPQRGQLWRAAQPGTVCLVVVVDPATGGRVPVMAASADRIGDDRTVVAQTTNGMRVAVWAGMQSLIAQESLDYRIGNLTSGGLTLIAGIMNGSCRGTWAPITSVLDDRILVRLELKERLRSLATPTRALPCVVVRPQTLRALGGGLCRWPLHGA